MSTIAKNTFSPPPVLKNAHVQSIFNSVGPRKFRAKRIAKKLNSKPLILSTPLDIQLTAEFDRCEDVCRGISKNAVVILLHGWEGSSQSAYQVTTAHYLLNHGYDVLRLNLRDHGDSHHLNKEMFNSTMIEEVGDAIASFLKEYKYPNVFLAGFSLGGNFTLRITADRAEELTLKAAVGICPPVDPNNAMFALNNSLFIYELYFFRRWTRSIQKKQKYFPDSDFGAELKKVKTLDDVNNTFIPKYTPFDDAQSYFASYALTGDRLKELAIPAYLIASKDDPILPIEDIAKIIKPKNLIVEIQENGGHCGFIQDLSAHSWVEPRL
ncbi:MAG: alpha/beta fold hydrolase, partial [Porticoccaceae bacterium]|nr:alpha/beta fold hydrolase [Porticoccaceae bacterium]